VNEDNNECDLTTGNLLFISFFISLVSPKKFYFLPFKNFLVRSLSLAFFKTPRRRCRRRRYFLHARTNASVFFLKLSPRPLPAARS
jgi:hypothetical protein